MLYEQAWMICERVEVVDGGMWREGQVRGLHIRDCAGKCSVRARPITTRNQDHVLDAMTPTRYRGRHGLFDSSLLPNMAVKHSPHLRHTISRPLRVFMLVHARLAWRSSGLCRGIHQRRRSGETLLQTNAQGRDHGEEVRSSQERQCKTSSSPKHNVNKLAGRRPAIEQFLTAESHIA